MLSKFQRLKNNDHHIHENIKVDSVKGNGIVNTHDHIKTLCEDMICKDESLFLVYAYISKVYGLFTNGTRFIVHMTPLNDEDYDYIDLDMVQVVTDKSGNTLLLAEEDGYLCDT